VRKEDQARSASYVRVAAPAAVADICIARELCGPMPLPHLTIPLRRGYSLLTNQALADWFRYTVRRATACHVTRRSMPGLESGVARVPWNSATRHRTVSLTFTASVSADSPRGAGFTASIRIRGISRCRSRALDTMPLWGRRSRGGLPPERFRENGSSEACEAARASCPSPAPR
jgi:hypothetical protein